MTRLKQLSLSWFRGAAEAANYRFDGSSVVIYGENGSGKSTFVDALEVLIRGSCDHLKHEYSGTHQEKGLVNTHRPSGATTQVRLGLMDGRDAAVCIDRPFRPIMSGSAQADVAAWDYSRVVLRQDEIASFIKATKAEKYSTLLPLLGLGHLELAAENVRQLARNVSDKGGLKLKQGQLTAAQAARERVFGDKTDHQINKEVERIYSRYVGASEKDPEKQSSAARTEIERQQADFTKKDRRYSALKALADSDITAEATALKASLAKLEEATESLVKERLAVINAAEAFVKGLEGDLIDCPACGNRTTVEDLRAYVKAEQERLHETQDASVEHRRALSAYCDAVLKLKSAWSAGELAHWRNAEANSELKKKVATLDETDVSELRSGCSAESIDQLETIAFAVRQAADRDSFEAPASVQALSDHARILTAATEAWSAQALLAEINELDGLMAYLAELEAAIRKEIRAQSGSIFDEISSDIQRLWDQLHPSKRIQNVHLHVPFDSDKAIDVAVQFHGVDQASPRLTLSEGYRNSLGLSIFLALAMRQPPDTPIILDDVVLSMDRNHRGMVADLLENELSDRQVILLTHERDWYIELTHLLKPPRWRHQMLLPWESPEKGIKFQGHVTSFDLARAHLESRPDSAANDARKIMDTELPIAAEKLRTRLPYRRGTKNDQRTGVEFLTQLIGDGAKAFEIKKEGSSDYTKNEAAIALMKDAERRMIAWGNPGSHGFDVRKAEAAKLIDACEAAIGTLICAGCTKQVWFADTGNSETLQCQCGTIRWRYGKT